MRGVAHYIFFILIFLFFYFIQYDYIVYIFIIIYSFLVWSLVGNGWGGQIINTIIMSGLSFRACTWYPPICRCGISLHEFHLLLSS